MRQRREAVKFPGDFSVDRHRGLRPYYASPGDQMKAHNNSILFVVLAASMSAACGDDATVTDTYVRISADHDPVPVAVVPGSESDLPSGSDLRPLFSESGTSEIGVLTVSPVVVPIEYSAETS